jgi:Skp family chaperone for outer membrane proteins
MKKISIFVIAAFLAVCIAMPAPAAKEAPAKESQSKLGTTKIGIVDMQKILQESKAAKAAKASFMKELETKKEKSRPSPEVQRLEQEIARLAPDASLETRRTKGDQLKAQAVS